jgi:hypothetical protein
MNSVGNINEDLISCQIWSMLKQSILILILLFYHFNNNRNKYRWNNVIISQIGQGHRLIHYKGSIWAGKGRHMLPYAKFA